ncbi:hypothetical protein [Chromobacterium paludis]|uniref:Uncharacterized protein n=1 Tax=Chromobacterium paludis TaxID=2605945 RepID=A0A5C1DJC5_9NEIS|nr:hypothetical protein [Chromobacterium paludis]QEL56663.1 hypothetical protein FYK34_14385 [Chromobacterium paludis]
MVKLTPLLIAALGLALLAPFATAGVLGKKEASAADGTARGRRIVQNQALGRALDKNPLGIAALRRLGDKRAEASGHASNR